MDNRIHLKCNLKQLILVKMSEKIMRATIQMACLFTLLTILPRSCTAEPSTLDRAESALKQIQAGDLKAAAVTLRQALDSDPSDALLHNLAGTLLLITGDVSGASGEWQSVLVDNPDDGLAQYGLGVTFLARRESQKAAEHIQFAKQ